MIGKLIAHYEILEKLGEGGMGVVYKARDTHLDRFVAIKVLPLEKVVDPQRRARFVQEAKAASALNHPNIIHIYDISSDPETDFIAMEYVAGEALDQLIPRKGMRLNEALKIAVQVADAMARAHEAGIVHRDLKPSNVMVDEHGVVKVVDFGLAKLTEAAEASEDAPTRTMPVKTDESKILGTVAYMSPEQAEGRKLDGRSDIFSFGAVLYEMVTGRRAFSRDTAAATLAAVLKEHPTPVREGAPEVPPDLEKLINRCLQKQQDRRWQAMADLRVALRELREESDSGAGRAAISPARERSRWRWAALAVLPLVAAGAWLIWRYGAREAAREPILTTQDVVVLADFVNSTGEPVFDGTLREALSNQIENSNLLRTMSPGRMRDLLADMKRPPDTPITAAVANEMCLRAGEKATLAGSIASLGSTYVLTLKAIHCQTGETLASQVVEAPSKEKVLGALAEAVSGIREKLGESLPNIQRTVNLGGTTASLEAYQAYAMGMVRIGQGQWAAAIPHLERATQLDPNLAMAYTLQAIAYGILGQSDRARQLYGRGFELRTNASERDRLWIEGRYYQAEGDLDRARRVFEELVRLYPNHVLGINSLGNIYRQFGDSEKALVMHREYVRLIPGLSIGYSQLMNTFIALGRFEEAHAVVAQMPAVRRNSPNIYLPLLRLSYLEGDQDAAEAAIQALAGTYAEVRSLETQQSYAFAVGKFRIAEELQAKAEEAARRQSLGPAALGMKLGGTRWKANAGLCSDVEATVILELLKSAVFEAPGAIAALATCGHAAEAERFAEGLVNMGVRGQVWDSAELPLIRARKFLVQGKPTEAIAELETARPFERSSPEIVLARGEACLMSDQPAEAAAEFRKILDVKARLLTSEYNAAQVGLARALAASGDIPGAKQAYETFLDLWKSADPGIPLLLAAQKEYAALR